MLRDKIILSYVWSRLSKELKEKIAVAMCELSNVDDELERLYPYQIYMFMDALSGTSIDQYRTTDDKLKMAAKPLVDLLQSEYDSDTTILVENDYVTVRRDTNGISFE